MDMVNGFFFVLGKYDFQLTWTGIQRSLLGILVKIWIFFLELTIKMGRDSIKELAVPENNEDQVFKILVDLILLIGTRFQLEKMKAEQIGEDSFEFEINQVFQINISRPITSKDYEKIKELLFSVLNTRKFQIPPLPVPSPSQDFSFFQSKSMIDMFEIILNFFHNNTSLKSPNSFHPDSCISHKKIGFDLTETITCPNCQSTFTSTSHNFFQYFEISSIISKINPKILKDLHNTPDLELSKFNEFPNLKILEGKFFSEMKEKVRNITSGCYKCMDLNVKRQHIFSIENTGEFYGLALYWEKAEMTYINAAIAVNSFQFVIELTEIYHAAPKGFYELKAILFKNSDRYVLIQRENILWSCELFTGATWNELLIEVIRNKLFAQLVLYQRRSTDPQTTRSVIKYAYIEKLGYEYDKYERKRTN